MLIVFSISLNTMSTGGGDRSIIFFFLHVGQLKIFWSDSQNHLRGLPRNVRTEIEVAVLSSVGKDFGLRTRLLGNNFNISHFFVWKILYDFLLYSSHIQQIQLLLPCDVCFRMNFCQKFLLFDTDISFIDETIFPETLSKTVSIIISIGPYFLH